GVGDARRRRLGHAPFLGELERDPPQRPVQQGVVLGERFEVAPNRGIVAAHHRTRQRVRGLLVQQILQRALDQPPQRLTCPARPRIAASRTARMTTPAWASEAGGGAASAAPTVSSSGSGIARLRRPYKRTRYPARASASARPTPARPGPMIPTAESVVIGRPP